MTEEILPISKYAGLYDTKTQGGGELFSPLIIYPDGRVTVAGEEIIYSFDTDNNKMTFDWQIISGIRAKGSITFDNENNSFSGLINPNHTETPELQVPHMSLSGSPAAAYYNGKLYCFYQGSVDNNALLYITFDGNKWDDCDTLIPNVRTLSSPAVVVYNDKLYCFHRGIGDTVSYFIYDEGVDRQIPNVSTSGTPAVTVFNGKLYCFYPGSVNKSILLYTIFDGNVWTKDTPVPNMSLSGSPTVIGNSDKLYCFYQGSVDNNALLYITFDGSKWDDRDTLIPNIKTLSPPALINIRGGGLTCFHRGIGDTISYFTFGKWDDYDTYLCTSGTPAVVDKRDHNIYCFYPSSVDKSALLYFTFPYR